jgi:hypothetical protein
LKDVLKNVGPFSKTKVVKDAEGNDMTVVELDGNKHGWAKDGVNSMVTGLLTFGKDALPA